MGVEVGSIGSFYVQQADGEYKRICKVEDAKFITIDRNDGPWEHIRIFEPNKTMTFSALLDFSRRARNRRIQNGCKAIFGVTYVEHKFKKKKKRSRKRIGKHSQDLQLL